MGLAAQTPVPGSVTSPVWIVGQMASKLPSEGLAGEPPSVVQRETVGVPEPHPSVELEQLIIGYLEGSETAAEVRQRVEEMLDDDQLWTLFGAVAAAASSEVMDEVLASTKPPKTFLHSGDADEIALAWRLATTRVRLYRDVVASVNETGSVPELVIDACQHPDVGGAFIDLMMANIASVAIGSGLSQHWPKEVVATLIQIWIEGERAHYSYLVPLASALGLPAEVDDELLPGGVMDLKKLAQEIRIARGSHRRLLDEARRSGLAVYPAPDDDQ